MIDPVEQLIDSLLYEGYALYPYTSAATKNATPTPFGIAYPPRYAAALQSTFDHLELRCVLEAPAAASVSAEVRFLAASGSRHEAEAQRLELAETSVGALAARSAAARPLEREAELEHHGAGALAIALSLSARALSTGGYELALRVQNRTPCAPGLNRAAALARSLLSTHPVVRVRGGRFISQLERPCASVNTFPVLASARDDVVIGAAIVLPDHPRIAPESRGGLFDSTEIEEALLLHVKTLTDAERADIEQDDPVVAEMIARAAAATPAEIVSLHGRVTLADPDPLQHDLASPVRAAASSVREAAPSSREAASSSREPAPRRSPVSEVPPQEPPDLFDPTVGEEHVDVDGARLSRGDKVRLRPGPDTDLHARLLDGRVATIERIMVDYDGRAHLGVTIDDDPGQELLRDSGRFLFFFAPEVEPIGSGAIQSGGSDEPWT